MIEAEECKWLNKKHGKGFCICDILVKKVPNEDCKKCKRKEEYSYTTKLIKTDGLNYKFERID